MIRKAALKDIKEIKRLGLVFDNSFLKTYDVEKYLENDKYIILLNDDKIINGLLIAYKNIDYYELEGLSIDENYQRRGLGTNLLKFFISNYGKDLKEILLEVNVNNDNAINFYKKNGFEIINVRKKYYQNKYDAYIMRWSIK